MLLNINSFKEQKQNIVILIEDGRHFESRVLVNEPPKGTRDINVVLLFVQCHDSST